MQVTIDVSEKLARKLEQKRDSLEEILERGLWQEWSEENGLRDDVFNFLARLKPEEVLAFEPSPTVNARCEDLLRRNKANALTPEEAAELDEMLFLDNMVSLLKAKAWEQTRVGA